MIPQSISESLLDERPMRLQSRDSLTHELLSVIFECPQETKSFNRVAEALGVDPTVPRIALALDLKVVNGLPSKADGERDRIVLATSRYLKNAYEELIRISYRGRLVIWVPCLRGDSVVMGDCRIVEQLVPFVKAIPDILAVGVGLLNQGPAGWALSAEEAFKALEFGLRGNPNKRLHLYSDIAVNESVRRTDNVLRYLNSLLERLSDKPELLTTLEAYFDLQQRRKVTADVLHIHPNTLNYRLERIEQLLGARLDDAGWIAKLYVAVRLRQASAGGVAVGIPGDPKCARWEPLSARQDTPK